MSKAQTPEAPTWPMWTQETEEPSESLMVTVQDLLREHHPATLLKAIGKATWEQANVVRDLGMSGAFEDETEAGICLDAIGHRCMEASKNIREIMGFSSGDHP